MAKAGPEEMGNLEKTVRKEAVVAMQSFWAMALMVVMAHLVCILNILAQLMALMVITVLTVL